jgi:hypothetical protein
MATVTPKYHTNKSMPALWRPSYLSFFMKITIPVSGLASTTVVSSSEPVPFRLHICFRKTENIFDSKLFGKFNKKLILLRRFVVVKNTSIL